MEEKKKSGIVGKLITIILLIIFLVGGFLAGIYYSTEFKTSSDIDQKETGTTKEETTKTEEISVNSRLVQFLYDEVTYNQEKPSHYFGWEFNNFLGNNSHDTSDFYANKADEKYKMILVGRNLLENRSGYAYDMNIPEKRDIGYVKDNDKRYFTKDYVESIYKLLFGKDATLDTSVPIHIGVYGGENYSYDATTGYYFKYHADVGGTTGPGGYTAKLSKAEKDGKTIKIYQDVKLVDTDETTVQEEFQYIYTFEQEEDGMYKFISRTKKQ